MRRGALFSGVLSVCLVLAGCGAPDPWADVEPAAKDHDITPCQLLDITMDVPRGWYARKETFGGDGDYLKTGLSAECSVTTGDGDDGRLMIYERSDDREVSTHFRKILERFIGTRSDPSDVVYRDGNANNGGRHEVSWRSGDRNGRAFLFQPTMGRKTMLVAAEGAIDDRFLSDLLPAYLLAKKTMKDD